MRREEDDLTRELEEIALLLKENTSIDSTYYTSFLNAPARALLLVPIIAELSDESEEKTVDLYAACIFALDICVSHLQASLQASNKAAKRILNKLMLSLAAAINSGKQQLNFWLPVLNVFYEGHVDLSVELKNAYFNLASNEDEETEVAEKDHLNAIREMIAEMSDLSVFDIAENFFAQSYAMPDDFFADLIIDLYSVEEGQDIALLTLLHPSLDVREIAVMTLEELMPQITLSSISLSRLRLIKNWYPKTYHDQFDGWLKIQRKKGVVFSVPEKNKPVLRIKATEVDGSGSQGVFIHIKNNKKNRLCGFLLKEDFGIKNVWMTSEISLKEVREYYDEAIDESITLRIVSRNYLLMITEHFFALSIRKGRMPSLHLLEIQELMGVVFQPNLLDLPCLIERLSVEIVPFTENALDCAFKRSKTWYKTKAFVESWYLENAQIDNIVNYYCNFVDGLKICALKEAMAVVFLKVFETQRSKWMLHFFWVALWLKAGSANSATTGQDSFLIAYAIYSGIDLQKIPIMQDICRLTVLNSIETMHERRSHLGAVKASFK